MIFLAKFGFTPKEVAQMSHIEVAAWIESYLTSQGITPKTQKKDKNTTTYIFKRRKKGT